MAAPCSAIDELDIAPAPVPQQSGGGGGVSESVSAPATEAPFVLPQSGDEGGGPVEPTITPYVSPTPDPEGCYEVHHYKSGGDITVCQEPGSLRISQSLRQKYNRHMGNKAAKAALGETVEPVLVRILVTTWTEEAVDDLVEYLEEYSESGHVTWSKGGDRTKGHAYATVDIELLPAILELEDVMGIISPPRWHVQPVSRGNVRRNAADAARVTQADQWHRAGFTGAGVAVSSWLALAGQPLWRLRRWPSRAW